MPITRQYPLMTPDSLRAKLHIDCKFFGTFTERSKMHEHYNGTKYVGTIENWGDEMLLEAHKLKMKYPPFNVLKCSDAVHQYLDLHYGTDVNCAYEPNAIVGHLKKDVLTDKRCYIQFHSCTKDVLLRSISSSDPNLILQTIYKTHYPPNFVLVNGNGTKSYAKLEIYDDNIEAGSDHSHGTMYYFNTTNADNTLNTDDEYRRNLIDPDSVETIESGVRFNTLDLQEWMEELPFVWCSVPSIETFENGSMEGNIDRNGNPLFTMGTDGNDNTAMYSLIFGDENLPSIDASYGNVTWMLKVYAKYDDYSMTNMKDNRSKELRMISLCAYDDTPVFQHVVFHQDMTWDTDKFHVYLNTSAYRLAKTQWMPHKPVEGDSDYDGLLYKNPIYMVATITNQTTGQLIYDYLQTCVNTINGSYNPIFIVKQDYEYNEFRYMTPRAQTGIHIDGSSDYSEHCVDKRNGTIYDMGEFDGLPDYYQIKKANYLKRPRVSLYALRDWITSETQRPMQRQSAGLLLDSGLPDLYRENHIDDLESIIHYKYYPSRTYYTRGTSVSVNNALSDIVYIDGNTMSDTHKTKSPYQMIYHGNRFFSCNLISDLNEDEFGHVFVISNDPSSYDNNDSTIYTKPARTLARICDIPTDYRQLTHITGLVSSVVIDKWYVRTECCYSDGTIDSVNGNDLQRIWNTTSNENVLVHVGQRYIFDDDVNMNTSYGSSWMDLHYPRWNNRNAFFTMKNAMATDIVSDTYSWTVSDGGSGYHVGSGLKDYVGGKAFETNVRRITTSGSVVATTSVSETKDVQINRANFDGRISVYTPSPIDGPTRDEDFASLTLEIDQTAWDDLQPYTHGSINGCFAFKFNQYDQLTIWKYNPVDRWWYENVIMTGDTFVETIYNASLNVEHYTAGACIMAHMLTPPLQINGFSDAPPTDSITYNTRTYTANTGEDHPNNRDVDLSDKIVELGYNVQDAYFVCMENSGTTNDIKSYELTPTSANSVNIKFPKTHYAPLYNDKPSVTSLLFNGLFSGVPEHGYVLKQPNVFMYNPYKTIHTQYEQVSSDVVTPLKISPITFNAYFKDMVNNDKLKYHVYRYTGYEMNDSLQTEYDTLMATSRDILYQDAIQCNPTLNGEKLTVNPVAYAEENGVPYTKEMLVLYLMEYKIMDDNMNMEHTYRPTMTSDTIHKIVNANTTASGNIQPTGDIVPVSARVAHNEVYVDATSAATIKTKPLYVFKLDTNIPLESLDGFHMRDEYSNHDISDKTLLIYQNTLYTFDKVEDTWKRVLRKS